MGFFAVSEHNNASFSPKKINNSLFSCVSKLTKLSNGFRRENVNNKTDRFTKQVATDNRNTNTNTYIFT